MTTDERLMTIIKYACTMQCFHNYNKQTINDNFLDF